MTFDQSSSLVSHSSILEKLSCTFTYRQLSLSVIQAAAMRFPIKPEFGTSFRGKKYWFWWLTSWEKGLLAGGHLGNPIVVFLARLLGVLWPMFSVAKMKVEAWGGAVGSRNSRVSSKGRGDLSLHPEYRSRHPGITESFLQTYSYQSITKVEVNGYPIGSPGNCAL